MNPSALAVVLFGLGVGYLVGDVRGAITGAVVGIGFCLVCTLIDALKLGRR